jgi:hypothetical protein
MPSILHHRHCEVDRMAHVGQAGRAAGSQRPAFHHTGVKLDDTVGVEAGADAGVEQGLVLHVPHRRDRRLQRAITDARPPGIARALDGGLAFIAFDLRDGPSPSVDDEGR